LGQPDQKSALPFPPYILALEFKGLFQANDQIPELQQPRKGTDDAKPGMR
jgi:hypothetical protein